MAELKCFVDNFATVNRQVRELRHVACELQEVQAVQDGTRLILRRASDLHPTACTAAELRAQRLVVPFGQEPELSEQQKCLCRRCSKVSNNA